jgi:hypothetical protein
MRPLLCKYTNNSNAWMAYKQFKNFQAKVNAVKRNILLFIDKAYPSFRYNLPIKY